MTHRPYPAPPRRSNDPVAALIIIVVVAVAIAIMGVIVGTIGSRGPLPDRRRWPPTAARKTRQAASIATDSKFTFHVKHIDTDARLKSLDGPDFPKGQFVKIWVAVHNQASRPRFVSADDQQLHAGGRTYSVDVDATADVEGSGAGQPGKISAGNTETIVLVYDVPQGVKPTVLEVHGSARSDGALLSLPND